MKHPLYAMDNYRKQKLICFFLCLIGMIAIMFEVIGCFTEAWLRYDMDIHIKRVFSFDIRKKDSVSIGLWTVTACETDESNSFYVVNPVTVCKTATIEQLNKAIAMSNSTSKEEGKEFLKSFLPQKILTVAGGLLGICSLALTYAFARTKPNETTGSYTVSAVSCIVCWVISGALLFAAVDIQNHNNANFEKETQMAADKPEIRDVLTFSFGSSASIILLGIGGSFGVLLALIIPIMIVCRIRSGNDAEAYTNQAI
ncbi:uncharacterized protein LOC123537048 [Mercenaria mercenaria]|uniref:uncharacterized protein LOC123537048 n=1 Tax=Mercenaria mercenaria TaxID=6596 RepID=UPI00234F8DF9|nr:uncharacterized protein LOC123537048 [Mercenaria mercenaria]